MMETRDQGPHGDLDWEERGEREPVLACGWSYPAQGPLCCWPWPPSRQAPTMGSSHKTQSHIMQLDKVN